MKKWFLILLILALILPGCAQEEPKDFLFFYYIPAQPMTEQDFHHGVTYIRPEMRDTAHINTSLAGILTVYLRGPLDTQSYASPFPAGSFLFSIRQEEELLQITMGGTFVELKDLELTIACACLAKTSMELTGVTVVEIRGDNALLDGNASIRIDAETLELLDQYQTESE